MRTLSIALSIFAVAAHAADLRMHIEATGEGRPVALVGGGTTGADSWSAIKPLLQSRRVLNAQPLAVQYGLDGRALPSAYSIRTESEALGNALASTPVDVIGWSLGALIALDFALQNPARVRTLTLIEPPAFWLLPNHGAEDEGANRMQELLRTFRGTDISEDQFQQFRCALGDCSGAKTLLRYRRSLLGLPAVADHRDDPRRLQRLTMPVLVVTGAATVPFHKRINQVLLEKLPNSQALELPGGHNSFQGAPEEFVRAWTSFTAK